MTICRVQRKFVLIILLIAVLVSCENPWMADILDPLYNLTVSFYSNGGTAVAPVKVERGNQISMPDDPTRAGHNFGGWYTDRQLVNHVVFPLTVRTDITLYAKWNPIGVIYSISLSRSGEYIFTPAVFNYAQQDALTVTVENTGNRVTGSLNVELSGAGAAGFELSSTSLDGINVDGSSTFTVRPVTGLAAGTYAAVVTVSGGNNIRESFNVSFTVMTFGVSLDVTGTHTFDNATYGYTTAPPALEVIVNNTSNQPTGILDVTLEGANPGSFTLSPQSLDSIASDGNGTFTVGPVTGLAAGTHTAVVTVSGGNDISASFTVSFTVIPGNYGISLSAPDLANNAYTFTAVTPGYPQQNSLTVTVTNPENQPTGILNVTLSGANPGSFTLSSQTLISIASGSNRTFTVKPVTGLAAGTHTAVVTISGDNDISASFTVSFTVMTYGVSLSVTGTHTFDNATYGYATAPSALTVTVENTGNQPTGTIAASLSGANSDSFTLSSQPMSSIASGGNGTFTISPYTGLAAGTHTAVVTVSGSNDINASFTVSFTVMTFGVSLDVTGTYTFDNATYGYATAPSALTVTVENTGNQPTGTISAALSGANAASFTLSSQSMSSIALSSSGTFTVRPITGLAAGIHTAVVTVLGGNGISANFSVSFTVEELSEPVFDNLDDIIEYLQTYDSNTADDPIPLKIEMNLNNDWSDLLNYIAEAGMYVALDLSGSAGMETFDPGTISAGKNLIVSLDLPDSSTAISAGVLVISAEGKVSFGNPAFDGFTALREIRGANIKTIGDFAFINSIDLDSGQNTLGILDNLEIVDFPELTSIGMFAFAGGIGLSSVNIPSVTTIGDYAFAMSGITSINIPNGVTTIGAYTFAATMLTSVIIPDSVTTISPFAFFYSAELKNVTIGNGVTVIGDSAFAGCIELTSITIPDSVQTIGEYAFSNCVGLTSINIPDSVQTIGEYAFYNCVGLTSVTIGNGVTSIGDYAFARCSALTSINIPDSVQTIADHAFYSLSSLTHVTIGSGVTSIGDGAFSQSDKLASVTFRGTISADGFGYSYTPFNGNLVVVYLSAGGGIGTYTTDNPEYYWDASWVKQP